MRIRKLTDADWLEFVAFGERYFGRTHNSDRGFNEFWFKRDSQQGWTGMVLENPEGKIAGVMMFLVTPCWFAGEKQEVAWISTGVVDEASRTKGGGALLYLWGYRNYPIVCALSGNSFSNPINDRLGISIPGVQMLRHVYVNSERALTFCQPGNREHVASFNFQPLPDLSDDYRLADVDSLSPDYDALWEKARQDIAFTTDRSASQLVWRYRRAPFINYRFWQVTRGNALVGLIVVRMQETELGLVCRIVDFIADPDHAPEVWMQALSAATQANACFTDFLVIGNTCDTSLLAAGFQPANEQTGLDALPNLLSPIEHRQWSGTFHVGGRLAKSCEAWRKPDALYFTKGDSDRDWPTEYELKRISDR
jgi:hypothetical protein